MPMLQDAERVSLLAVDPLRQRHMRDGLNLSELTAHLGRHGVSPDATELSAGERSVTDALLAHAAEFGADLLVMGAYGHSRIWEFIVGGTTQDLLEKTTIPLLISR